jgi:hypothetical protein
VGRTRCDESKRDHVEVFVSGTLDPSIMLTRFRRTLLVGSDMLSIRAVADVDRNRICG